jgi:hypothetical protein
MGVLKGTRAALKTYDKILEWHHREKGDIAKWEDMEHVDNVDRYISRRTMIKILRERYFFTDKEPRTQTIKLPNSKATVKMVFHNAWDCIESLLTDPRVKDEDYNFHDNNPLASPPAITAQSIISELHTGMAYKAAYNKFIKIPGKQVLLPIVMYIDGAITGQFSDLPVTALKIALGIHTRKHRDKDMAWRTLGYVAQISTPASRGKNLVKESGHMEAENLHLERGEGEQDTTKDVCKAQDFHTMLECLLSSFVDVQNNGFIWDLRYRGKTYHGIEFVPFVVFVKCDTDEADLLCGSYKSRTSNVAQLCRYCTCPTMESDCVYAAYPQKTVPMILELVEAQNFDGLRRLSQQMIKNAFYKLRFHPYNKQGIHGACPSEMLHALLLGVFKYTRECFFEQIGPTSKLAGDINGLAQQYGDFYKRQSERDTPKCSFKEGIVKGKTTAKEFRGILTVIASVLRCKKGHDLLSEKEPFSDPAFYKDWVLLVERLLEWEAFLNEPEMTIKQMRQLNKKNRYIMSLIKRTVNRTKGMGLKLTKFHVIIHMWTDIFLYGVPLEVDTGSNESQHKSSKIAAKLTQKNVTTFDFQTCTRLDEFFLIELALAELNDDLKLWDYFTKPADPEPDEPPPEEKKTSGVVIRIFQEDKFGPDPQYSLGIGKESREPFELEWSDDLVRFLFELQQKVGVQNVQVRGEHRREGMIFRGHPNYREQSWKDWAEFSWEEGLLPGQIWCFVIIDSDPQDEAGNDITIHHGGIEVVSGTYAVIENAKYDPRDSEKKKSDLFIAITKESKRRPQEKEQEAHENQANNVQNQANGDPKNVVETEELWERTFYLADVESIASPLLVIPNIGGESGMEYLVMKPRCEWAGLFKRWLDQPHDLDVIPETEPIPSFNCLH